MDIVQVLSTILPLALTAGINLYGTVLVVGLCLRYNWIQGAPEPLYVLASDGVILAALLLYFIEFLADKFPLVDNSWDAVHTFIRPMGAAVLSFSVVGEVDPQLAVIAAMVAGSVALTSHTSKAGARVALNMASPLENVSNTVVSLAEDLGVAVLAVLALQYPYVATGITLVVLALLIVLVPRLVGWTWFTGNALVRRIKGSIAPLTASEALPEEQRALLPGAPALTLRGKAHTLRGAGGRSGFVSLVGDTLFFTYDGWLRSRVQSLALAQIDAVVVRSRPLLDVVEMRLAPPRARAGDKHRLVRFVFTRDRAPLVARLVAAVQRGG